MQEEESLTEVRSTGKIQIEIKAQHFESGMYFLKLEGNEPRVLEFIKVD